MFSQVMFIPKMCAAFNSEVPRMPKIKLSFGSTISFFMMVVIVEEYNFLTHGYKLSCLFQFLDFK